MATRLKKRPDGRYIKNVYLGKDEKGAPVRKAVYGRTISEVEEKERQLKIKLGKGIKTHDCGTFGEWAERFFSLKKGNVGEQYLEELRNCIRAFDVLSDLPINQIKPFDIQNIIINIAQKNPHTLRPSSKRTVKQYKMAVAQIFSLAIRNRVIEYNPAESAMVKLGKEKVERQTITDEQIDWIQKTPHRAQTPAMLMLFAGLRRGEVIPLLWNDIDFEECAISITKAANTFRNQIAVKTPKTAAGHRKVYMPDVLVNYLKAQPQNSTFVCPSAKGVMMSVQSWRTMWQSYMLELNRKYGVVSETEYIKSKFNPVKAEITIDTFTAHQLRHTNASLLYRAGIDPMTAKDQLGHSNIQVTLGIYTHLDKTYKARSMQKLNNFLKCSQSVVGTNR